MEAWTPFHIILLIGDQLVDPPAEGAVFISPYGFGDYQTRPDLLGYLSEERALASVVVYPYHVSGLDATRLGIAGVDLEGGMTLNPSQPLGTPKVGIEEVMGGRGDAVKRKLLSSLHRFKALPGGDMRGHGREALPGQGLRVELHLSGGSGKSLLEGEKKLYPGSTGPYGI